MPPAKQLQSVTGFGVRARVHGRQVLVGRAGFVADEGVDLDPVSDRIERLETTDRTVVVVAADNRPLALIALGDALRQDAADAVIRLRDAGLAPVLATGDNVRAAAHVARQRRDRRRARAHAGRRREPRWAAEPTSPSRAPTSSSSACRTRCAMRWWSVLAGVRMHASLLFQREYPPTDRVGLPAAGLDAVTLEVRSQ